LIRVPVLTFRLLVGSFKRGENAYFFDFSKRNIEQNARFFKSFPAVKSTRMNCIYLRREMPPLEEVAERRLVVHAAPFAALIPELLARRQRTTVQVQPIFCNGAVSDTVP
jgi:hypothetical protein